VAQAAHAIPKNGLTGKAVIAAGCGPKDWPERRALLGPRG